MASAAQIADLRRLIDQPDDVAPWTDALLSDRIDSQPDLRSLAGTIWSEKAAAFAGLVDVKEGNSDRKLSQLHRQALIMAQSFGVDPSEAGRRATRTRQIVRG